MKKGKSLSSSVVISKLECRNALASGGLSLPSAPPDRLLAEFCVKRRQGRKGKTREGTWAGEKSKWNPDSPRTGPIKETNYDWAYIGDGYELD